MPERRVLVTGGAGFIGANLVPLLADSGYAVTVLDDLSRGQADYLAGLDVRLVEGDVRDRDLVAGLVPEAVAVVHLAAQTGVPGSLEDPRLDCDVNVLGTLNLLEAYRAAGGDRPPRFVFASSNASLGRQRPPASEDKAPLPSRGAAPASPGGSGRMTSTASTSSIL
jgi:UDP-glucose 4-epimerase